MPDQMDSHSSEPQHVTMRDAFRVWCRVAILSFGGPAGQIAVMHRILIEEKKWIDEERFLHALNYCMLLPGPEAQQLATYIGWLLHRTRGGLLAGILFVIPGLIGILGLSIAYVYWHDTELLQAVFFGLKPAVMAIVIEAVMRIGKRVLTNRLLIGLATVAFLAIFLFDVPFPALIACAGLLGFIGGRWLPAYFCRSASHSPANSAASGLASANCHDTPKPSLWRSVRVSVVCLTVWFLPLAVIRWWLGDDSAVFQQGVFFSKAAVVTFGGAYSVLAYVAQQAVETFHWLEPGEMLDGLGMAETTPGPLIMVVQFVAFMGAYRNPGSLSPLAAAIVGSFLTTWVTFAPCFYWVFLGAPYVERLRGNRLLNAALTAITASVVGVILNLGVWFSVHTLFQSVETRHLFGMRLLVPEWASLQFGSLAIALLAFVMTFKLKRGMGMTLGISVMAGLAIWLGKALLVL
ncbi:MAG: hypothetical protein RIS70_3585 [Planctomycetota bacterium]|jgi:chromate transporter